MSEKKIENDIKKYLKAVRGLFFWKEHGGMYGTSGIPDLIACYKGVFIALEVKSEKGKLTPLQKATLEKIKKSGGYARVVRSVYDTMKCIDEIDKTLYREFGGEVKWHTEII